MTAASRQDLVDWARDTIRAGSKSFGMASRLLPRRERENAWLLYAWCRTCDDITDGQELGHFQSGQSAVSADLRALTHRALHSDAPVPEAFAALREVARDAALPAAYLDEHLRGFDLDRAGWRPQTLLQLEEYCFYVAGAVGCLMAAIMGVPAQDADTLARASDLGIAFQLDNIARDLVDDARHGRCYIPADWLHSAGMAEADIAAPENRVALAQFARELNTLAQRYQASSLVGAARLAWRCRFAILAAGNIYAGIGEKVVRRGAGAWDSRTATDRSEKLIAVGRALLQALASPVDPGRAGLFNPGVGGAAGSGAKPQVA
jgi:15-cis-phytoene synthase